MIASAKHALSTRFLSIQSMNQQIIRSDYAIRGHLINEQEQLRKRLHNGEKFPFETIIPCNIGDPFSVGKKPMTFPREVISCIENSNLLKSADISDEAKARAAEIIESIDGEFGAYTKSQGIDLVRTHVAEFIKKRDGYPCKPDDIYLFNGASRGATFMMTTIIQNSDVGIMTPYPTYPIYKSETIMRNGRLVPFYLKESDNWSIDVNSMCEAYDQATKEGIDVRAMVIINPGNPTGNVLPPDTMRTIIDFCEQNNIVLIADEVYQDVVFNKERPFISFKKMVCQTKSNVQLVSLNSISKGFMGECGHRGGYMELFHFPADIKEQISKASTFNLCPNTVGQVLVDTYVKPPKSPKQAKLWEEEKTTYVQGLKERSEKLWSAMNELPGITCMKPDGGWYVFPRLELPLKALEAAKVLRVNNMPVPADYFWCYKLLHEVGVVVVPGSGFGQVPGTFHFRMTFLPEGEKFNDVLDRITRFQTDFMKKYA